MKMKIIFEKKKVYQVQRVYLLIMTITNKSLVFACDSSLYEWGTALPHILEDGSKQTIKSALQTLTEIKRNYSQRETILFGMKRYHR